MGGIPPLQKQRETAEEMATADMKTSRWFLILDYFSLKKAFLFSYLCGFFAKKIPFLTHLKI